MAGMTHSLSRSLQRFFNILLFFSLLWFSACTGEQYGVSLTETADNNIDVGDGGEYSPSSNGENTPCAKDSDGSCLDETNNTENISISTDLIDYGMSELESIQCQEISIPGGLSFEAEIDDVNNYEQFAFLTGTDTYKQERIEGSKSVTICYLRNEIGSHESQFKLVVNASSSASSYAYIIPLKGETTDKFFTITTPTENQIIDSREGHNEGRDDDEGDFLFTAEGNINMNLTSILKDEMETPIIIDSAGVKYKAILDESGHFKTTIAVPQASGIYNVNFTAETNKELILEKSLSVVVATTPEVSIEVRDDSGNSVSSSTPTDVQNLIVGIKVKNLNVAGSDAEEMPVEITNVLWNGENLNKDVSLWYDSEKSWCQKESESEEESADDYSGFEPTTTYCFALSDIENIVSGQNTISVKASNALGEAEDTFVLISDYEKPVIKITSPTENQLFNYGTNSITIKGSVENYAPLDSDANAPQPLNSSDKGSYCLPDSEEGSDDCPKSSVRLWINQNAITTPIFIYPELPEEYQGLTADEINADIATKTPERCRTSEETDDNGESTTQTQCNLPEGEFEFTISFPNESLNTDLNLYLNIIQMQADGLAGSRSHRTTAIKTFYTGTTNPHAFSSKLSTTASSSKLKLLNSGDLKTGQLGSVNNSSGFVQRAPLMFNLSEGIFNDKNMTRVVQKMLNDNLPFHDVANGWTSWPTDSDGNIDIEADYQEQYKDGYQDFWADLDNEWQEKFIQQGLHSSNMATKYWALVRYLGYGINNGMWDVNSAYLNSFEREGDPENDFNVALDRCEQPITTAFVPIGDLQHVYKPMGYDLDMIPFLPEWPYDIALDDYGFNDFVSGKWIVHSIEYKEGNGNEGKIDLDICVVPQNADVDNCDDDIPYSNDLLPAVWGHFVAYNLVEGGLLGPSIASQFEIDDPTMPLIWSVGKLRIKLKDVIKIRKVSDGKGGYTNKVSFDTDGITPDTIEDSKIIMETTDGRNGMFESETLHDHNVMSQNSIQIYPYARCEDYYKELLENGTYNNTGEKAIPFGCDQDDPEWNYPFILEKNSVRGKELYNTLFAQGQSYYLLNVVWQGVIETFGKMIRCMDEETINPLLNPEAFPYPVWVAEGSQLDTSFSLDNQNDEIALTFKDDAQSPLFDLDLNLTEADIHINHPDDPSSESALSFRLPMSLTAHDVFLNSIYKNLPVLNTTTTATEDQANESGHLIRTFDQNNLENYPLSASDPEDDLFAAISINIEEIFNSISYLIFKKGPFSYLDLFDVDELEVNSSYSIGLDKVVLARFDICDNLAGQLDTNLPPGILFSNIASEFNYPAMHIDVVLNKNAPVTFALRPVEGYEDSKNMAELQLGIRNIQLSFKELETTDQTNAYKIGREVVKLRLDGSVSLKVVYDADNMKFDLYLDPYEEQNLHLTVVPGHGGAAYDDVDVVFNLLNEIIPNLFKSFSKSLDDAINGDGTSTFSIQLKESSLHDGYFSLKNIDDVELTLNVEELSNGTCDDSDIPVYYSENSGGINLGNLGNGILPDKANSRFKMTNLSSLKTNQTSLTTKKKTTKTKTTTKTSSFSTLKSKSSLTPSEIKISENLLQPEVMLAFNACGYSYQSSEPTALEEAFCDLGIQDIYLKPTIELDHENGYLHLSSEFLLQVYDWLKEDVE